MGNFLKICPVTNERCLTYVNDPLKMRLKDSFGPPPCEIQQWAVEEYLLCEQTGNPVEFKPLGQVACAEWKETQNA